MIIDVAVVFCNEREREREWNYWWRLQLVEKLNR